MADSKIFVAVDPTKFATAKEFIDESKRLSSFQGCKELIVVDELGNRDTVEDVSLLALWTLISRANQIAWQPWARAALIAAGIL